MRCLGGTSERLPTQYVVCSGDGAQSKGKQQQGKGKGKGGGGGPSNKAAAAGSSNGEASTSRVDGSRPSTPPSASAGHHSTVEDAVLPPAEAASDTQQPAGGGKKEKELQRKERQRQRRMEEAKEALHVAIEAMLAGARCVIPLWLMCIGRYPPFPWEVAVSSCSWQGALTCGGVCGCSGESALNAVEEATAEAAKHGDRSSEQLTALVAEARVMIDQAKSEQAERARAATEEAEAAAAVKAAAEAEAAAERLQMQAYLAALTSRMQSDALRLQQMRARVGSSAVPAAHKDKTRTPTCPVCRQPIQQTVKVFCS
jgi:hypothetical protein